MEILKKASLVFVFVFSLLGGISAQTVSVTPTTAAVNLVCTGSDLTLPPPTAGSEWIVRYSATKTTTASTGIALTGGITIPAANLNTGFYYLTSKSLTAGSCESDAQEIPVYVLKPLVVDITTNSFCVASTALAITSTVTNPENAVITTLAYQWYTVSGGTETAIAGATTPTFTPSAPYTVGTTTYRLRVGYLIGAKKYCPQISSDKNVVVTPIPSQPLITPGQIIGAGEIIF